MKKEVRTVAERQADYRKRRGESGENGERRLNLWVSTKVSLAIHRLALRYCVTKREMIERLVLAKDEKVMSGMNDVEFATYLKADKTTLRSNGEKTKGKNMKKEINIEPS